MDYLQYYNYNMKMYHICSEDVLNLIINGLPSIQHKAHYNTMDFYTSFKPYYKWITFNT